MKIFIRVFFLCSALAIIPGAHAASETAYQARLKQIRQQVSAMEKSIAKKQAQRGKGISTLKQAELEIAAVALRLRTIDTQLQQAQLELDNLNNQSQTLLEKLNTHRDALGRQMAAAYKTGRTSRIQLLLNQQNPALISRMLHYYNYFNRARQRQIDQASVLLKQLEDVRQTTAGVTQRLQSSRGQLRQQHIIMQNASEKRRKSIALLEKRLSKDRNKLSGLLKNQQDLEHLLAQLNQVFAGLPPSPLKHKPFKLMQGKLPWPAAGKLKAAYNSLKGNAQRRWKGMLIGAKTGSAVRAIYYGQVAFSDWMNGFGMILIIDHGDGYMSIYAHNQALNKTQGERVTPGEVIATVGNSGGQSSGGIYFEIRRKGQPVNPHKWVKKSITSVSIQ